MDVKTIYEKTIDEENKLFLNTVDNKLFLFSLKDHDYSDNDYTLIPFRLNSNNLNLKNHSSETRLGIKDYKNLIITSKNSDSLDLQYIKKCARRKGFSCKGKGIRKNKDC